MKDKGFLNKCYSINSMLKIDKTHFSGSKKMKGL